MMGHKLKAANAPVSESIAMFKEMFLRLHTD